MPGFRAAVPSQTARRDGNYFFTGEPAEAGAAVLSLFTVDFFTPFLWLFLAVVLATLFEAVEELCAGGLAGEAAVWAAKVNGTAAAVRASARIVFFICFYLPAGRFYIARSQVHLAGVG
jgi:hypothetical protein